MTAAFRMAAPSTGRSTGRGASASTQSQSPPSVRSAASAAPMLAVSLSTLLAMLSGLLVPDEGRASVADRVLVDDAVGRWQDAGAALRLVHGGDAGTVITAIFQSREGIEKHINYGPAILKM